MIDRPPPTHAVQRTSPDRYACRICGPVGDLATAVRHAVKAQYPPFHPSEAPRGVAARQGEP